uniref:Uncharacterized protein n=1 Tax=Rhizophora mucronata TaxID=61149 RepID=A0A2P2N5U8_RHIMU
MQFSNSCTSKSFKIQNPFTKASSLQYPDLKFPSFEQNFPFSSIFPCFQLCF